MHAQLGQLLGGLGPDAPERVGRPLRHDVPPVVLGEPEDAAGLAEAGGELGAQLVVADADRAGEPGLGGHRGLDRLGQRVRVAGAGAEERLVPPEHLDDHRELAQRGHHAFRNRQVGRGIAGQEHRLRAAFRGRPQWHSGVDAELACFVGRRRDDRAFGGIAVAAYDDRFAAQLRTSGELDRGDELVEIDVQDPGHGSSVLPAGHVRPDRHTEEKRGPQHERYHARHQPDHQDRDGEDVE